MRTPLRAIRTSLAALAATATLFGALAMPVAAQTTRVRCQVYVPDPNTGMLIDAGQRCYATPEECTGENGPVCQCTPDNTCVAPVTTPQTTFAQDVESALGTNEPFRPSLQIDIPGVSLTRINLGQGEDQFLTIPWIGEYIKGVYAFAVNVAGILAGVMIVIGGFRILTAGGDASRVQRGRQNVSDALVGLGLVFGAYLILNTVNPSLTTSEGIQILRVNRSPYRVEYSGDTEQQLSQTIDQAAPGDIYCPKSGGSEALPQIIASMQGKVAYRFGGKGGPPPYSEVATKQWFSFNTYCPEGNLCLDCSGFVNYALRCAGLPTVGGGTSAMFSSAEKVNKYDIDDATINDIPLRPGDLIGYTSATSSVGVGHVFLYIGNGMVAESHGGTSGRQPGANPVVRPLSNSLMGKITHVRRTP